jgi:hypothetical protein
MLKDYLSKLFLLATFAMVWSFSSAQNLTVDAPASIAGSYTAVQAAFGPLASGQSGPVVLIDDGAGATTGCTPASNDLTGAIALIDRGVCNFAAKQATAEAAGAVAVVICNNLTAFPDSIIVMGGTDNCASTIPAVMVSLATCQTIKAELANGVTATLPDNSAGPGQDVSTAEPITEGAYTAPMLQGTGSVFTDATAAQVYSIVAPATGLMNVNSCNGGADTRLAVMQGCRNTLTILGNADDECPLDASDPNNLASNLDVLVFAGEEYLIYWDNAHSDSGFDFEVSFGALPDVDVTFTVDMLFETVDPAGVYIAGTFNNWTPEPMTNNGNSTWSFTASVMATSEVQWKFLNGPNGWETSPALADCGVDDGQGSYNRVATINSIEPVDLGSVCFNGCADCVPTDCGNPIPLIVDDFESYTAGTNNLGAQALHWTTWSGVEGGTEDGNVSTAQASSGSNSLGIIGGSAAGGPQDVLLLLGDKTTGHYGLAWSMYIPSGNLAYYNIQHFEVPGTEWAIEVDFEANGVGTIDAGAALAATFSYPYDTWFDVVHYIDLDNDHADLYINNNHVYSWQFSVQANEPTGTKQLGGVDFFPRTTADVYFVDDVVFAALPPPAAGQYCHTALPATEGINTVEDLDCFGGPDQVDAPSAAWFTYTPASDGILTVSSCDQGVDTRVWVFSGGCGGQALEGMNDDRCISAGTDPYASYREVLVTAGTEYLIVWDNAWETTGFDFEITLSTDPAAEGNFCETAIPVGLGVHTIDAINGEASVAGPNIGTFVSSTTPYAQSEWYSFTPTENSQITISSCAMTTENTRVWVYEGSCGFDNLTLIATNDDGCATQSLIEDLPVSAGTTYYIEWDNEEDDAAGFDWEISSITIVEVTFIVNMSNEVVTDPDAIYIAGSFNGWSDQQMTPLSGNRYQAKLNLEVGTSYQYKFKNGPNGWEENNDELINCGIQDGNNVNRLYVGEASPTVQEFCFNTCEAACADNTTDRAFANALSMMPNPAGDFVNISYQFDGLTNLNVRLINSIGQVMAVRNYSDALVGTERIDLSQLPSGAYTVVFSNGESTFGKRLIVE